MKKQIFVLSLAIATILSIPSVSRAEDPAAPDGKGEHKRAHENFDPAARTKALKEKLSLTDDQATKIEAIFTESGAKVKELRDNTALSADDRRTQSRDIMKSSQEQVKAILTPEQVTKLDEMNKERREKMAARRADGHNKAGKPTKPDDANAPK